MIQRSIRICQISGKDPEVSAADDAGEVLTTVLSAPTAEELSEEETAPVEDTLLKALRTVEETEIFFLGR